MASRIEWTGETWNPVVGCKIHSPGCNNCYAMRDAYRKGFNPKTPQYHGLTRMTKAGPVWTGEFRFHAPALSRPLKKRKPTTWFVNSMSDLFGEGVEDAWIDQVFAVMALCPQHTFQVLTKRAERMRAYSSTSGVARRIGELICDLAVLDGLPGVLIAPGMDERQAPPGPRIYLDLWPLPNVWLGVSAERQQEADERIPHLLAIPAAVRFLSAEPLLGPMSLRLREYNPAGTPWINALTGWVTRGGVPKHPSHCGFNTSSRKELPRLDWVIAGGESGPGARPMHPEWARQLRDQCAAAGVPFFFKQWGDWGPVDGPLDNYVLRTSPCASLLGDRWQIDAGRHDAAVFRIGKKAAGRLLDGVEHNAMPELAHA